MGETMKAQVLTGKGEHVYADVPRPTCERGGMLLRIDAVGVCGSDARTIKHGHAKVGYPAIIGHENAGTVVEIGPEARTDLVVGDRVVVNPAIPCGTCYYCRHDDMSGLCQILSVYGSDIPGGMAEYLAISAIGVGRGQLLKIPGDLPAEEAILVESLSSVVKAQEQMRVGLGDTVVIFGAGPIGCLQTQIARLRGAVNIVLADINGERLAMAGRFGASRLVNSAEEDIEAVVREMTDGRGADVVIVAAPSAQPHRTGLQMLRKEGRLSMFGGLPRENPWSQLDANLIHYNRLEIRGAYSYSFANFQQCHELVTAGRIDRELVTHRLPLRELAKAVELIETGRAIKVVLNPWME